MINLTSFSGKTVYEENGNEAGYVLSPIFADKTKKLKGFLCADLCEEEFFLPFDGSSERFPFVKSKQKPPRDGYSPILRPVYSAKGKYLGIANELTLQGATPRFLWVDTERYDAENVAKWGDCILLKPEKKSTMSEPKREPLDLLGKKIRSDVLREDGTVLFKKGGTVTKQTLRSAVDQNKIIELTAKTISPDQKE